MKREMLMDVNELDGLSVLPLKRRQGQLPIEFAEGVLPGIDRQDAADKINRKLFACGCVEGTVGSLLFLGLEVGYSLFTDKLTFWQSAGLAVLAVMFGGMAGRFIGKFVAERDLRSTIQGIKAKAKMASASV